MNSKSFVLLEKFLPKNYITQAHQALSSHENEIRILLEKCKIPKEGWADERIELFLGHLALMDSNNFTDACGLGEREGRMFSNLVAKRNYNFSHGIGRSGDVTEVQPKAIGSTVLNRLTNELVLDLLQISGLSFVKNCFVLPMATGMSMSFCMLSIRSTKPDAKYVLMPRIDQKSCIKSVITAGFTPIIIENVLEGDELRTDVKTIEEKIKEFSVEKIACIFSTTSCFAPRATEKVEDVAALCKKYDIFHLVNNAYGLQSSKCTHAINQASKSGRVDVVIQSTDKNLMVPVGGSIIAAFDETIIDRITQFYPGRASSSQSLDILITLLSMGTDKYHHILKERKECFEHLKTELYRLAKKYNEKVLETPHNSISMGFTLDSLGKSGKDVTHIGSMLFTRYVSGVRVITAGEDKNISGCQFKNFGSHSNDYPHSYFTAAAAIGITRDDVDLFIKRLDKVLSSVKNNKHLDEKHLDEKHLDEKHTEDIHTEGIHTEAKHSDLVEQ